MRCALYFGSFNPLHIGHITIAEHVIKMDSIDCFRFVLSPHNPIKNANTLQDAQERLNALNKTVCKLNNGAVGKFEASDIEFNLPKPLYTYNTLQYLKQHEPQNKFIVIIGGDNLAIIEKWYKWREILLQFEVWVYPRKGYDARTLCKKYGTTYIDAPQIDISSTEIRNRGE
ncbi:MAG: nicotinate (nicotinamide) nucleotide adenylyltransferase [Bacteroidales bacterium]